MIYKALGVLSFLFGALLFHRRLSLGDERRCETMHQLSQALMFLSRGVGERHLPMPRLLNVEGFGSVADSFLRLVYDEVFSKGNSLEESWDRAVEGLELLERDKEELRALSACFSSGAEELSGCLSSCAKELAARQKEEESKRREREKSEGPLCVCAALLIVILLI